MTSTTSIQIAPLTGSFAENKDVARDLRLQQILPAISRGHAVSLDFEGVQATTQSFIHALLSDVLRQYGSAVLDRLSFKSCTETVQKIIEIVVDYMQESGVTEENENENETNELPSK